MDSALDTETPAKRAGDVHRSIPAMARQAASRFAGAGAVVDGDVRLTFEDVAEDMCRVSAALTASGVRPGDRVAVWAPNSVAWIPAALGILGSGAWLVPINTRFKADEVAYVLDKSNARAAFVVEDFLETDYLGTVRGLAARLRNLDHVVPLPPPGHYHEPAWQDFLERGSSVDRSTVEARLAAVGPDDISDIIFTSGTTGEPKGVMLRHGASLRAYAAYNRGYRLACGDRHLVATPFFHCFGYKAGWMLSLMVGATTYPMAVFDPVDAMQLIARERITHWPGAPTMFLSVLDHPDRDRYDLTSVKMAMAAAASVPVELVGRLRSELGIGGAMAGYGLTENHALVSITEPDDPPEVVATTVGRPVEGMEIRVVADSGEEVPTGDRGELLVRSYALMDGYLDEPEATESVVEDGWLHTGDIVTVDADGYIRIVDRKKDIFIMGGFNVSPSEVEKSLMGHPGVSQVAVVGLSDEHFGEVGAAFVIPKPGFPLTPDDVIAFARERLANYKVPRRVDIVTALPTNATGKVLRRQLRTLIEQPSRTEKAGQ